MLINASMIEQTLKHLQRGEIVAIPTDTVYGMVCDASNAKAIEKLYTMKARPTGRPFQVLINSMEMAQSLAQFNEAATKIGTKFWPGPLTLVRPIRSNKIIDYAVCGNLYTIGLRWPKHELIAELIDRLGAPLAASSVNTAGEMPLTTAEAIREEFPHLHLIEGETGNTASTIAELKEDTLILYREGVISQEQLEACL